MYFYLSYSSTDIFKCSFSQVSNFLSQHFIALSCEVLDPYNRSSWIEEHELQGKLQLQRLQSLEVTEKRGYIHKMTLKTKIAPKNYSYIFKYVMDEKILLNLNYYLKYWLINTSLAWKNVPKKEKLQNVSILELFLSEGNSSVFSFRTTKVTQHNYFNFACLSNTRQTWKFTGLMGCCIFYMPYRKKKKWQQQQQNPLIFRSFT